jgi:branched-chain amino acid transport system permease protein
MEKVWDFIVGPLKEIWAFPPFFFETLIGGLLTGVLYSLIALGFVLIFKASGVFNFAQGAMVLFAALAISGFLQLGWPVWAAFLVTTVIMVGKAFVIERTILRPLVNQAPIILFMATIGLTFIIEGIAQAIWGAEVRRLDVGIPRNPIDIGPIQVNAFDISAGVTAAVLVAILGFFFQYTRVGRALRAVADDNQAALSVGIPLRTIWVYVWSVSGFVALVAGIVWGSKIGVQISLALIALKALPVLILGGFTSIPGAIVGGLIIGAGEKVAEVFWAEKVGGAVEDWFAYMLAMVFLVFRPQGLFGERIIERV